MGTNALRSSKDWKLVPQWKKREAYIAAARCAMERFGYEQWDHFLYRDYVERRALAATFYKRHLSHSNGQPIGEFLTDYQWTESERGNKKRGRPRAKQEDVPPPAKRKTLDNTGPSQVLMFDDVTGEFVQVLSDGE